MRRRLPSPALVIASLALFLALAGAGVAAGLALVRAPKPVILVSGSMSANGKWFGGLAHGSEKSTGVYTLTINGDTFAPNSTARGVHTFVTPLLRTGADGTTAPSHCGVSTETVASDGSAGVEIDCFAYDPAAGWQPADAAFDVQVLGPGH
jgi:hypothetical protein